MGARIILKPSFVFSLHSQSRITSERLHMVYHVTLYADFIKAFLTLYIHVTVRRYRFLFDNHPDAIFIQIYCHKTLHVLDNFFAHHQESPTVHSALVSFMQVMMTVSKQSQDGTAYKHHAPSGIRTHNLSRRAAAVLHPRPCGYWDRHQLLKGRKNKSPIRQ